VISEIDYQSTFKVLSSLLSGNFNFTWKKCIN